MIYPFSRAELIIGRESIRKLSSSKIAVFGIGGVGSYAVEALARCGVGEFLLIDNDTICISNINRQIHAMHSTVDQFKVEAMRERVIDINPDAIVNISKDFVTPKNVEGLVDKSFSYVIDAIDNVTAKLALIILCKKLEVPMISSMGTGNKLYPEMLTITDIYNTSVCPLAKVMRKELRRREVESLNVCYSPEEPITPEVSEELTAKRQVPGSISFVPSVAGLLIAGKVVRDIISNADVNI